MNTTKKKTVTSIDEYIASFPHNIQEILHTLRNTIHLAAPNATETISYGLPTFKLNGKNLVHFAAWKNHIGFYPTPSGTEAFQKELAPYKISKGAIQFPIEKPMPLSLVRKITAHRIKENSQEVRVR